MVAPELRRGSKDRHADGEAAALVRRGEDDGQIGHGQAPEHRIF
jgi:hypothetical protein